MRFFPGIGHAIESVAWHIGTSCVRNRGRQSANMQSMKLLSVQKQNIPTEYNKTKYFTYVAAF